MSKDYDIHIRKGRIFWLGQLQPTEGIPTQAKTYRASSRDAIILKMESKRRNRISEDKGPDWEVNPDTRPFRS